MSLVIWDVKHSHSGNDILPVVCPEMLKWMSRPCLFCVRFPSLYYFEGISEGKQATKFTFSLLYINMNIYNLMNFIVPVVLIRLAFDKQIRRSVFTSQITPPVIAFGIMRLELQFALLSHVISLRSRFNTALSGDQCLRHRNTAIV